MFYKVPFSAVPDLVARRQVLLRDGFAYVREAQVCVGCCESMLQAWKAYRRSGCSRLALHPQPQQQPPVTSISAGVSLQALCFYWYQHHGS